MSYRNEKRLSLAGSVQGDLSQEELAGVFENSLQAGMHGLCFSPYQVGQEPGSPLSVDQIQARLDIVKPYTKWVRTFSCTEGNEEIPRIAKENGLKTLVGAWLGKDPKANAAELEAVVEIAKAGYADRVAVGNEVLYRKDMAEADLLAAIEQVKSALPGVTVGYVDAYYEFVNRPALVDACDVVMANCYPYWESCDIEYSLLYMKGMYEKAKRAGGGKRVIITESGWPSAGTPLGAAIPSEGNAMRYFINAQEWSREEGVELFYFSSFDEAWKVETEGDVGAYWGIWGADGKLKYPVHPQA